jgi:hypothetical protein
MCGGLVQCSCAASALERVAVDDDPNIRPFLPDFRDLRRIGFTCYRPVTGFVMPDIMRTYAFRHEIVLAFTPDPFPPIE